MDYFPELILCFTVCSKPLTVFLVFFDKIFKVMAHAVRIENQKLRRNQSSIIVSMVPARSLFAARLLARLFIIRDKKRGLGGPFFFEPD
jgi:hypothetical protein